MNSPSPSASPDDRAAAAGPPRVLYALQVDVEPCTAELIALWLAADGWPMSLDPGPADTIGLILVEMAFPRRAERQRLRALAEVWPQVPVIVLSPTFFAGVPHDGEVARELGVAAVLATPLKRERFVAALRSVLERRR